MPSAVFCGGHGLIRDGGGRGGGGIGGGGLGSGGILGGYLLGGHKVEVIIKNIQIVLVLLIIRFKLGIGEGGTIAFGRGVVGFGSQRIPLHLTADKLLAGAAAKQLDEVVLGGVSVVLGLGGYGLQLAVDAGGLVLAERDVVLLRVLRQGGNLGHIADGLLLKIIIPRAAVGKHGALLRLQRLIGIQTKHGGILAVLLHEIRVLGFKIIVELGGIIAHIANLYGGQSGIEQIGVENQYGSNEQNNDNGAESPVALALPLFLLLLHCRVRFLLTPAKMAS